MKKGFVNSGRTPFIPRKGWSIYNHDGKGFAKFNPKPCSEYEKNNNNAVIEGSMYCNLNANHVRYVLRMPPRERKPFLKRFFKKYKCDVLIFCGTTYHMGKGRCGHLSFHLTKDGVTLGSVSWDGD